MKVSYCETGRYQAPADTIDRVVARRTEARRGQVTVDDLRLQPMRPVTHRSDLNGARTNKRPSPRGPEITF